MRFINRDGSMRIRTGELRTGYNWITLKSEETIELPEEIGIAHGLEKVEVTESQIGETKVETKQFNSKKSRRKNAKE